MLFSKKLNVKMTISHELCDFLAKRDKNRCSYCLTEEDNCNLKMHVDHIIPESAGGTTNPDNLCLACFSCNIYKGKTQIWTDPITKEIVLLFHPVLQNWSDHFCWDESIRTCHSPCFENEQSYSSKCPPPLGQRRLASTSIINATNSR